MLKRQRTLTPPPSDIPHGSDYGFGFGMGSAAAEDDYFDATGFGHIAKRRRVTVPVPPPSQSRPYSQLQPNGRTRNWDDDDSADCEDSRNSNPPALSSQPHDSQYSTVNNILHRLHLEHTRRSYLSSLSANGKPTADATDDWDAHLFDVAKFHAHNTVALAHQAQRINRLDGSKFDSGSCSTPDEIRETQEEATSICEQYQERNR